MRILYVFVCLVLAPLLNAQNILPNGGLESGTTNWTFWADATKGYTGSFSAATNDVYSGAKSGKVIVNTIGTAAEFHKIVIKNNSFSLQANIEYKVSFRLRCSKAGQSFLMQIHRDSSPYNSYAYQTFNATTSWDLYSHTFISPVNTSDVRFALKLGEGVANYYFDDVKVEAVTGSNISTVIDPAYSVDWSNAGRPGGIPDVPNVHNVLDYGAIGNGTSNDLTAFQNAVNAAGAGQAVYVPAGDYLLNGKLIMKEGVVLRGECPSTTKLLFNHNGAAVSSIELLKYGSSAFVNVTAGLNKGSQVFTVANSSGYAVGNYIEVQQDNDPALMYTNPTWNQTWAQVAVGQLFKVTAVNGNQITVDRSLNMNLNPNLNPQMRRLLLIKDVGIENLYIERLDAGNGHTIFIKNAAGCWVRNIESNMTSRAHIYFERVIDSEVVNNYLHHSHDYGGGGHGYGLSVMRHSTSNLFENNIFKRLRHAMTINGGVSGNVFGYNYSTDPHWSNSSTDLPPDISIHGHYTFMNLFEGNIVQEANFSDYWGPSGPGNTLFRNRIESGFIYVMDHSHNSNVIANELTGGTNSIYVHQSVNNTWKHSNNINGTIDATINDPLPSSLYMTSKPDFLTHFSFPALGSDVPLGANTIDAKQRFDNNEPMLSSACNPGILFDPCVDTIVESDQPIISTSKQARFTSKTNGLVPAPNAITYTAGQSIQLNANFEVVEGALYTASISPCQ